MRILENHEEATCKETQLLLLGRVNKETILNLKILSLLTGNSQLH